MPPAPHLDPGATPDGLVTLTVAEAVALARYVNLVTEARASLAGCSLITWSDR